METMHDNYQKKKGLLLFILPFTKRHVTHFGLLTQSYTFNVSHI